VGFDRTRALPKPTPAELHILNVLWRLGQATVRQVHEDLNRTRPAGYTTVLKLMQIMTEKGLLERDESDRAHVYRPAAKREQTQRQMVGDLLDRVFSGSAAALLLQALSHKPASRKELAEIRRMLDEREGRRS
jgi:BlaI family transcriptional regulator, penicillinase repressor